MKNKINVGIVEGFFSRPLPIWTPKERLNIVRFVSQEAKNINTYLYCPKDDPYVVQKWDKLYPPKKIRDLKQIITFCRQNSLVFFYGLNPVSPVFQNNGQQKAYLSKIEEKFAQLQRLGVNNFCLLFDDIPLAYDIFDRRQKEKKKKIGQDLVSITNCFYQKNKKQIKNLWFCSPDYFFLKETALTKQLRKLDKDIALIWTGNSIYVRNVTPRDLRRVKRILGSRRKIIWWSNYPVNDCEQNIGQFNLGGFNGPSAQTLGELTGIMVNPMREPYANLPLLITFSNYLKEKAKYNRAESWRKALRGLLNQNWESNEAILKSFSARNLVDNDLKYPYSLSKTIRQYLESIRKCPPSNKWGKLFIFSIASVFKNATGFLKIANQILSQKLISKKEFLIWDKFPTNTDVPGYLPVIFKIIKKRIKLLPRNFYSRSTLKNFFRPVQNFQKKYRGSQKLFIPKCEAIKISRFIRIMIDFERDLFLKFLNSPDFTPTQKIKIFSLRQNINWFYC